VPNPQASGRRSRDEDLSLVTGLEAFVADVRVPDALACAILRSPIAHGQLRSVDTRDARELPGVRAVLTAADVRADLGSVPTIGVRIGGIADPTPWLQPVIATDRVRYTGEPIAVVVADDRYVAEDALGTIDIEIEPLDAVVDPVVAASSTPLFAEGNEVQTIEGKLGRGAEIFDDAPVVVEAKLAVGRHTAMPIEPRGLLAIPDDDGRLHIYGSAKVLHWNRAELARHLGVDQSCIRYVECAVGGSFGVRGEYYPEDFLVPWAARLLNRSVRWLEDRWEHFVATNHAREQLHQSAIAGTEDGRILGIRSTFWADLGAYVRTNGLRVPEVTAGMLPGPYRIEHVAVAGRCVVTSRTPTGTYRGPGRVESTFVRERLVDLYADRIGMEPIEVRRRNLLTDADLPLDRQVFAAAPRVLLEDAVERDLFETVVAALPIADVETRRARGELVGIGVATFLERSGTGPPVEHGSVEIDRAGEIIVRSGASSVGQGVHTTLAALVAEALEVDPATVRAEPLDTDRLHAGTGSFGSRSTITAGNAVVLAARGLIDAGRRLAAELLGAEIEEIEYCDGAYRAGEDDLAVPLAEVAKQAHGRAPDDATAFRWDACFTEATANSDFGAHGAVVCVDRETGDVVVERLVLGFESGPPVNVHLVEDQLRGAALQGIGGALFEELAYDELGNPTTTSFVDYLLPTIAEAPTTEIHLDTTPSRLNPLGLRGVGEGGLTGVPAAVVSAVGDALGRHAEFTRVPLTLDSIHTALDALTYPGARS
jgi:aerobic carbon-monoxide dehydrogenase large subunit